MKRIYGIDMFKIPAMYIVGSPLLFETRPEITGKVIESRPYTIRVFWIAEGSDSVSYSELLVGACRFLGSLESE